MLQILKRLFLKSGPKRVLITLGVTTNAGNRDQLPSALGAFYRIHSRSFVSPLRLCATDDPDHWNAILPLEIPKGQSASVWAERLAAFLRGRGFAV